jgi:ribosomal-protein-alanine N-acetyltransferase
MVFPTESQQSLLGKSIILRSLTQEDAFGDWPNWLNDAEVTKFMNKGCARVSSTDQLHFVQRVDRSDQDLVFAICTRNEMIHLGNVGIHQIDWEKRTGQFGIIIGRKDYWGKGIGTEAWTIFVDFCFRYIGLHTVYTKIAITNLPSLRVAEKLGFEIKKFEENDFQKGGLSVHRYFLTLERCDWEAGNRD